jgi:hypothetical protein
VGGSEVDVVVVAGAKGLNASGMLPHEASVIATRERVEMKMTEFLIPRRIVGAGAGHSITKRRAP